MSIIKSIPVEIEALTTGQVFHAPVEKLSYPERVQALEAVKFVINKVTERKEALRVRVLDDTETVGKPADKGNFRADVDGTVVIRERRVEKVPKPEKLALLLEKSGLPLNAVFDEVVVQQLNPSKLEDLIEKGKLKREDVDELRDVTFALKVTPGGELASLLQEAEDAYQKEAISEGAEPKKLTGKKGKK